MNYLIVGASSGLGRELCYTFAKNNNDLIICSRDLRDLNALKSDIEKKFNQDIDELSQETENLVEEIEKWQI